MTGEATNPIAASHNLVRAGRSGRFDPVGQAIQAADRGVDVIIAQGSEAGGYTGTISTMALVPQVVDAVSPIRLSPRAVRRPLPAGRDKRHRHPKLAGPVAANGPLGFRYAPFGRDLALAPGGAPVLSPNENRCAAFAGASASSASATSRFRESIPHAIRPLPTLRTPRYRDARRARSRPAC